MIRLCAILVVIFIPLPSNQHFIWPLDMCLLADICNHTWIPECGLERDEDYYRLFLDECDMFEYNCDNMLYFEVRNYGECFAGGMHCPPMKCPPTSKCPKHRRAHEGWLFKRAQDAPRDHTTPPNLPAHMLRGKRRYTPYKFRTPFRVEPFPRDHHLSILKSELEKYQTKDKIKKQTKNAKHKLKHTRRPAMKKTAVKARLTKKKIVVKTTPIKKSVVKINATKGHTKVTIPIRVLSSRLVAQRTKSMWETMIIKTSIFISNGRNVVKIFKGYRKTKQNDDSDFLE
ncbi:uncharacterized protein LOC128678252 [Plodia interpunctella]|uniref:uncharacterized protein LOC128678252 n=1 Tax=Plodia interpunctella TaxID=58824 RepID=UPI002367A191|nr:uncharacterized protein LOC128678252 [Plodia interpunctella]